MPLNWWASNISTTLEVSKARSTHLTSFDHKSDGFSKTLGKSFRETESLLVPNRPYCHGNVSPLHGCVCVCVQREAWECGSQHLIFLNFNLLLLWVKKQVAPLSYLFIWIRSKCILGVVVFHPHKPKIHFLGFLSLESSHFF